MSPDHSYILQLSIEDTLAVEQCCFQTALLYTTDFGERRIRIVTMAVPVVSDLSEVYKGIDQFALTNVLSKIGNWCFIDSN